MLRHLIGVAARNHVAHVHHGLEVDVQRQLREERVAKRVVPERLHVLGNDERRDGRILKCALTDAHELGVRGKRDSGNLGVAEARGADFLDGGRERDQGHRLGQAAAVEVHTVYLLAVELCRQCDGTRRAIVAVEDVDRVAVVVPGLVVAPVSRVHSGRVGNGGIGRGIIGRAIAHGGRAFLRLRVGRGIVFRHLRGVARDGAAGRERLRRGARVLTAGRLTDKRLLGGGIGPGGETGVRGGDGFIRFCCISAGFEDGRASEAGLGGYRASSARLGGGRTRGIGLGGSHIRGIGGLIHLRGISIGPGSRVGACSADRPFYLGIRIHLHL